MADEIDRTLDYPVPVPIDEGSARWTTSAAWAGQWCSANSLATSSPRLDTWTSWKPGTVDRQAPPLHPGSAEEAEPVDVGEVPGL